MQGLHGCPKDDKYGLCPLEAFVKVQKKRVEEVDWEWGCLGDWEVPPGLAWNTTTGDAPVKPVHVSL